MRSALADDDTIASFEVSLDSGEAVVTWKTQPEPGRVVTALSQIGYPTHLIEPATVLRTAEGGEPSRQHSHPTWRRAFNLSWQTAALISGIAFILLTFGEHITFLQHHAWFRFVSVLLASVVQIFCGARFYLGAFSQARAGRASMDTLVALGSTAAFGFSTWRMFVSPHEHMFFMESTGIIAFVSLGHWLEARTSQNAESTFRLLLKLAPDEAYLITPESNAESVVPAISLRPGQLVSVKPGQRIPADAKVHRGMSTVDESMLTGESLPINKNHGDLLFRGTTNLDGHLVAEVTKSAESSALARITELIRHAQSSRASIQKLGDKVSNIFVPIVLMLATLTAVLWGLVPAWMSALKSLFIPWFGNGMNFDSPSSAAIMSFTSVMIVACPCAMGLATPVALMAASNFAARRGILLRDAIALEKAGSINAIIFDKTGTLTTGQMECVASSAKPGDMDPATHSVRIAQAASLASLSEHPVSRAISKLDPTRILLKHFKETRGHGIEASDPIQGSVSFLGSSSWVQSKGIDVSSLSPFQEIWMNQGATVVTFGSKQQTPIARRVSENSFDPFSNPRVTQREFSSTAPKIGSPALPAPLLSSYCFAYAISDPIKPASKGVLQILRSKGLELYIVSGDHKPTVQFIANQLRIPTSHVQAEAKPEDKVQLILSLQEKGYRVAFVGDGINDAPALRQANLGLAVTRASDVARESADVLLIRSDIEALPEALDLSKRTLRIIKQNLFWAFFYNVAAIPLAVLGFLSPIVCAIAMGASDLIVVGNSLRLLRTSKQVP